MDDGSVKILKVCINLTKKKGRRKALDSLTTFHKRFHR